MSQEINCKMSISQAILNSLVGEWQNNIRKFASIINENIDDISSINDHDERYKKIIELLNFEETDANKIIKQPNKILKIVKQNQENNKNYNDDENSKNNAVKIIKKSGRKIVECPIPFWCVFENGDMIESTINSNNCCALKNPLYNQCINTKLKNSDYCAKCSKTVDENGIPKCGNIAMRIQQFSKGNYKFITPDNIEKKIYFRDYCNKKNFNSEDLVEVLKKNNIKLNENEINKIMYKREKKATGRKPKKIKENEENNDENDEENDDDTKSVNTNFTEQTENEDDEENETIIERDITKYGTIKTGQSRFGILLENKTKIMKMTKDVKDGKMKFEDSEEIFDLYEVCDYVSETCFNIEDFETPIAFFKSGKITKLE